MINSEHELRGALSKCSEKTLAEEEAQQECSTVYNNIRPAYTQLLYFNTQHGKHEHEAKDFKGVQSSLNVIRQLEELGICLPIFLNKRTEVLATPNMMQQEKLQGIVGASCGLDLEQNVRKLRDRNLEGTRRISFFQTNLLSQLDLL